MYHYYIIGFDLSDLFVVFEDNNIPKITQKIIINIEALVTEKFIMQINDE